MGGGGGGGGEKSCYSRRSYLLEIGVECRNDYAAFVVVRIEIADVVGVLEGGEGGWRSRRCEGLLKGQGSMLGTWGKVGRW